MEISDKDIRAGLAHGEKSVIDALRRSKDSDLTASLLHVAAQGLEANLPRNLSAFELDFIALYDAWNVKVQAEATTRLTRYFAESREEMGAVMSGPHVRAAENNVKGSYERISADFRARYPELKDMVEQIFD